MAKSSAERAADRIRFQSQIDVDRLSNARGYPYGDESTINYKKNDKKKKAPKPKAKKKNKSLFDIIDLED